MQFLHGDLALPVVRFEACLPKGLVRTLRQDLLVLTFVLPQILEVVQERTLASKSFGSSCRSEQKIDLLSHQASEILRNNPYHGILFDAD